MSFLSWRNADKTRNRRKLDAPGEAVHLTETGKTLAGLVVVVAALGALSWIALTLAQA